MMSHLALPEILEIMQSRCYAFGSPHRSSPKRSVLKESSMLCLRARSVSLGFNRSIHSSIPIRRVLVLLAFVGFSSAALSQAQNWTPAENRAVSQITQGGAGDFSDPAPVVSNAFVKTLLSGGFKDSDKSHNLDIDGITISNAVFQEQVNVHFEVLYRVVFDHCQFQNGLDFSGSLFDKDLVFTGSSFGTPASYTSASSADDPPVAQFINATVKGTVSFDSAVFDVPVDFTKAHVKELDITNTVFESNDQDDPDLDLSAVSVETDLSVSVKTTQPRNVQAQLLSVGRLLFLGSSGTGFFATREFNLADGHFQKVVVDGFPQWQANSQPGVVSLDGFSFNEINLYDCHKGKPCEPGKLLELLDSPQVVYAPQPYLMLEQYLTTVGNPDDADNAYIHMRRRQRSRRMHWATKLSDRTLDWVLGYGREPSRALWWALGFVALGMLIFSPRHMVPQDQASPESGGKGDKPDPSGKKNASYSRFWYSLDVLAPAIELGADKAWEPDPNWWLGRNYSYVHRILGWILVPLILAALTGVIH
jgi:hypothetical protein